MLNPDRPKVENQKFVIDKINHPLDGLFNTNSLTAWLAYYYTVHVKGAPLKTEQARFGKVYKIFSK